MCLGVSGKVWQRMCGGMIESRGVKYYLKLPERGQESTWRISLWFAPPEIMVSRRTSSTKKCEVNVNIIKHIRCFMARVCDLRVSVFFG